MPTTGLANSDIKEDALAFEVTTLEEIVKAVEIKESAKEANRTLSRVDTNPIAQQAAARNKFCYAC